MDGVLVGAGSLWPLFLVYINIPFGDRLHEQKFASLLIDAPSNIARTCFHSCVGLGTHTWLLTYPTTPTFHLSSAHFFIELNTRLGLPHPTMAHLSWCHCGHAIDDLGTHLLWCPCGSECTTIHNTFQNIVAIIALENGTHVQKEVSHLFPHHIPQQVDILITRNDFCTLMDIVVANPIRTNMV
jgi:hypothetical protein